MSPQGSQERVTYFAETDARNKRTKFGIKAKDRTRHTYVIGKTGMGKSTLLENMAIQDIQNGEGMAFIDPHGKTADLLLDYVPENRVEDVMYLAPFDSEYPISFNIMEDVGYDKRHLVMSGLISAFKKIWVDAWSARMEYILGNTLLALLEYPDSTLLSISRMFSDKAYRKKVVDNVTDPTVRSFWVDEFAGYSDRFAAEATPAIQNKVGQFTSNPIIRNIIGQPHSHFDFRKLMDERKIVIINLSKGQIGEINANLLGSMLITKMYLSAMSRADLRENELDALPNFYLYVDEFQSFANESFADILSEARKYKLNLTIAHQYIAQMSDEVKDAVFGNVGTMVSFRVGAYDAEVLEKEFSPTFTAEDMVNLGFAQVYLKLMIDGVSSPPFSATTIPPITRPEITYRDDVIEFSRRSYARSRDEVEAHIKEWHGASDKRETEGTGEKKPAANKGAGDKREHSGKAAPAYNKPAPKSDQHNGTPSRNQSRPSTPPHHSSDQRGQGPQPRREPFNKKRDTTRADQTNRASHSPKRPLPPIKKDEGDVSPADELKQAMTERNKKEGKKTDTGDRSALRDLLSSIKGGSGNEKDGKDQEKKENKDKSEKGPVQEKGGNTDERSAGKRDEEKDEKKSPHEIPEDELKKLLDVDDER